MDTSLFVLSIVDILVSFTFGVSVLMFTFTFATRLAKKRYNIDKFNISFSIIKASILFAVGYQMTTVFEPLLTSVRLVFSNSELNLFIKIIYSVGFYFLYFGLAIIYSYTFVSNIALRVFAALMFRINKIDEINEIKNNNIAISIITCVFIIVMSLILRNGLILLLESFVPYPKNVNFTNF